MKSVPPINMQLPATLIALAIVAMTGCAKAPMGRASVPAVSFAARVPGAVMPSSTVALGALSAPLGLSPARVAGGFSFQLSAPGSVRVDLTASGPGTDWGKDNAEAAVVSVMVDGQYDQDLVLWGGATDTAYALSLGQLPAGSHTIDLRYAAEKSRPGASGALIASASASLETFANNNERLAADHSPIVYGRDGLANNHNDTPLGLFHTIDSHQDGSTTITYGIVFSNEDGGDGSIPMLEQAVWGRLVDMETLFITTLDAKGSVLSERYEGALHGWHSFGGRHRGTHPVIRTSTANNNVSDQGVGPLCFRLTTDHPTPTDLPQEDLLRQNPRWYSIMGKELLREGKIDPNGHYSLPHFGLTLEVIYGWVHSSLLERTFSMPDPRDYLYVELETDNTRKGAVYVHVDLQDGTAIDSDLGMHVMAIARDGWNQTAVLLPPHTPAGAIASVSFLSLGSGHVKTVGHVYRLGADYLPVEVHAAGVSNRY